MSAIKFNLKNIERLIGKDYEEYYIIETKSMRDPSGVNVVIKLHKKPYPEEVS